MTIPMELQKIYAIPEVNADIGKVALQYGPMIYAVEEIDINGKDPEKVVIDKEAPMQMVFDKKLLGGVWTIKGKFTDQSPMLAIPFYARLNRDLTNKYCVWMNEKKPVEND